MAKIFQSWLYVLYCLVNVVHQINGLDQQTWAPLVQNFWGCLSNYFSFKGGNVKVAPEVS